MSLSSILHKHGATVVSMDLNLVFSVNGEHANTQSMPNTFEHS